MLLLLSPTRASASTASTTVTLSPVCGLSVGAVPKARPYQYCPPTRYPNTMLVGKKTFLPSHYYACQVPE